MNDTKKEGTSFIDDMPVKERARMHQYAVALDFSDALLAYCEKHDITRPQLAKLLGISNLKLKKIMNPDILSLAFICHCLALLELDDIRLVIQPRHIYPYGP